MESQSSRKRMVLSQDEWRRLILAWQSSGLSQQSFCKQHGLALSTFNRWQSKLGLQMRRKKSRKPTSSSFLPVSLKTQDACATPWALEIACANQRVLRLRSMPAVDELQALLEALE